MANYYYGCVPALAWILGHHFFKHQHFMWISAEYYPYRLPNPKSSNPHLIYQDLYQPWKDSDDFDKLVTQSRVNLRKAVMIQQKKLGFSPRQTRRLKRVCDKVDIAFFYPIVIRVDLLQLNTSRYRIAGSGITAGSHEYVVEDLKDGEFDALFLDFDSDADFTDLITDAMAGTRATPVRDPLDVLEARC